MAVNERNRGGANGDAERDPALDRLYREAAAEAPPAHLDAAILAAAHREARARPRALAPALRRWHVPISIAAVVVVSVSVVMLVREEEDMPLRQEQVPAVAMPRIERADAPPTEATQVEAPIRSLRQAPRAELERRQESRDDASLSAAVGKPAEDARRESTPPAVPGVGAVATPAPAARPVAPTVPVDQAPPGVAGERAAPALADTVTPERVAVAPAAPGEPRAARSAADAPQAKPQAAARFAKSAEQDRLPVWHAFEKEPPEKWLAQVDELRKQGRAADAEEMLSEFKRRFPAYPLPAASK